MTDDIDMECGFALLASCGRVTLEMSENIAFAYVAPCIYMITCRHVKEFETCNLGCK